MARASNSATPLLRSLVHRPQGVILVYNVACSEACFIIAGSGLLDSLAKYYRNKTVTVS